MTLISTHLATAGCNVKTQGDSSTVVTLPATESLVVAGTAYVAPCSEAYPRLDFTVTDVFGDAVSLQSRCVLFPEIRVQLCILIRDCVLQVLAHIGQQPNML